VGDEVIVLKKYDDSVVKVIGHTDGVRACDQTYYFRLYLNGALCEYGGESILVNGSGLGINVKTVGQNPLTYGVTSGGIDLKGLSDSLPVVIRLNRTRTVGSLCQAQYDASPFPAGVMRETEMFWGYEPYDSVSTPQYTEEELYDESWTAPPAPPNPWGGPYLTAYTAKYTNNVVMVTMPPGNALKQNYVLYTTTVGAIKAGASSITISEAETIRVFDIYGALPPYMVAKVEADQSEHGQSTSYEKSTTYLSGSYEVINTTTWDDGTYYPCDEWYTWSQAATYTGTGKPAPEITDAGVYAWVYSESGHWDIKNRNDCSIDEYEDYTETLVELPRVI
jgi:hypothetical protein